MSANPTIAVILARSVSKGIPSCNSRGDRPIFATRIMSPTRELFTPIRELFASVPVVREHPYRPGRLSINVKRSCCEARQGGGVIRIEMPQFLPYICVPCNVYDGRRYNQLTPSGRRLLAT